MSINNKRNADIRQAIKDAGLFIYEVAELFGVAESTFLRWLHSTLPEDKRKTILERIKANARKGGDDR